MVEPASQAGRLTPLSCVELVSVSAGSRFKISTLESIPYVGYRACPGA